VAKEAAAARLATIEARASVSVVTAAAVAVPVAVDAAGPRNTQSQRLARRAAERRRRETAEAAAAEEALRRVGLCRPGGR
jgi:hypothetical protein